MAAFADLLYLLSKGRKCR